MPHRILIITDDRGTQDVLKFVLETRLQASAVIAASTDQAFSLIQNPHSPHPWDAILLDIILADNRASEILQMLHQNSIPIPVIVITTPGDPALAPYFRANIVGTMDRSEMIKPLLRCLSDIIPNITSPPAITTDGSLRENYYQIHISLLIKVGLIRADLYLQLSNKKMVRVLRQGDFFEVADIDRYRLKNIEYLYLQETDLDAFIEAYAADLRGLADSGGIELVSGITTTRETITVLRELSTRMQMTPATHDMVQSSLRLISQSVDSQFELKKILDTISRDDIRSYLFDHSALIAYTASALAQLLGWNTSNAILHLSWAALVHDLSLTQPSHAVADSLEDFDRLFRDATAKDRTKFESHPTRSALLAQKFMPEAREASIIVNQHHELPDGSGFPKHIVYHDFHTLSCVFIVAEKLVRYVIENPNHWSFEDFSKKTESFSKTGFFKEIFEKLSAIG